MTVVFGGGGVNEMNDRRVRWWWCGVNVIHGSCVLYVRHRREYWECRGPSLEVAHTIIGYMIVSTSGEAWVGWVCS